uniref:Chromosome 16 open reading frame 86 n=1 Tax=Moschus moschiferus TaxID=68415 RepID=A0A8C6FF74_MOSMO
MDSEGDEKRPGAQEGTAVGQSQLTEVPGGHAQNSECPVMGDQFLVPAHEDCQTQGEDKCPIRSTSEPKIQERLKLEEDRHKPEVEALEQRGPRPMASTVRPSYGPKRKPASLFPSLAGLNHQAHPRAESELPQELSLQREEPENNQSEPSPSAKQHKKAKKRKSLGTPVVPVVASTVSAPSGTLGPERKAQRLRPLYQYINYCNPELNQAGEGDREAEAEVELTVVPEEAGVEQLQALLPVAGELGSDLTLPCPSMFVPPTHTPVTLGEEASEEPGGLPSLGVSGCLKAEMDKSTQVDINKMLSVCNAPLVPPLSPQYK